MSSKGKLEKLSTSKAASKTFIYPKYQSHKETRMIRYVTLDNARRKPEYPAVINRLSAQRRNYTENSNNIRKSQVGINVRSANGYKKQFIKGNSKSLNLKNKTIDQHIEQHKIDANRDEKFIIMRQQKIERLKDVYNLKHRQRENRNQREANGQRLKAKINSFEQLPRRKDSESHANKLKDKLILNKREDFHYVSKQQLSERHLPKFLDFCEDKYRDKHRSQDKESIQNQLPQSLKQDHIIAKVKSINKFPQTPPLVPVTFKKNLTIQNKYTLEWFLRSYEPHLEIFQNISSQGFAMSQVKNGVYFGQMNPESGSMQGRGVLFYSNGKIFEGHFNNGVKEGLGYEEYPDRSFYIGNFSNNRREGKGKFQWSNGEVYDGQWKDNKKSGSGIWKGQNNLSYVGEWQNDSIDGFGVLIEKGSRYEGQFRNFMKWGKGTLRFDNGEIYTGMFKQNLPNGVGDYYWNNGDHYHGQFANGKRHGEGTLRYSNGGIYFGVFQNDKKSGQGQQRYEDNLVYQGQFQNDLRHGWGVLSCESKVIFQGFWINNSAIDAKKGKVDQIIQEQPSMLEKDPSKNSNVRRQQSKISQMRHKYLSKKQSRYIFTKNKNKEIKEETYSQPKPFQRACNCERHRQKVLKIQV